MSLTKNQIARISLLILKGHTLNEIAKLYGCSYSKISTNFRFKRGSKCVIYLGYKAEPYFEDEFKYGSIPTYKYEDLSELEKNL